MKSVDMMKAQQLIKVLEQEKLENVAREAEIKSTAMMEAQQLTKLLEQEKLENSAKEKTLWKLKCKMMHNVVPMLIKVTTLQMRMKIRRRPLVSMSI